jgi:hypothetical protein
VFKGASCTGAHFPLHPRSHSHEIMSPTRRYVNLALLSKNLSDVTVRPTAAPEFTDERAVRLQA